MSGAAVDLALCGLGPMGMPIARRLLAARGTLTVWNRTAARADELVAAGAQPADTPAGAARAVVLTVLPDLPQVEEICRGADGLLAGWRDRGVPDPVLVVHGTVSPRAVAAFAERMARRHGVTVLDAPMSGGTAGAAAGELSLMVGGEERAVGAVTPVMSAYGRVIRRFGPAGSGALAKLCNQVVVAATVCAVSEALLLAERGGLDRQTLLEVLQGGLAGSEVLRQKGGKWLHEDYAEGGSAANQLKDLRFVEEQAAAAGLELPVASAAGGLFRDTVDAGQGELDHTAVIRAVARRASAEGRPADVAS